MCKSLNFDETLNIDPQASFVNKDLISELLIDGNSANKDNYKTMKWKRKRRETVYKSVIIGSKRSTIISGIYYDFVLYLH